jgi:cell division septal protein FtsQ
MLKKIGPFVFIGVIVSIIFTMLLLFPGFDCREITVSGNSIISQERFDEVVNPFISKNTLLLNLKNGYKKTVKNSFLECNEVSFKLKSLHHLHVIITEKRPWVTFLVNHKTVVVSEDGTILSRGSTLSAEDSSIMLVIRGVSATYFEGDLLSNSLMNSLKKVTQKLDTYFPEADLQLEYNNQEWTLLLNDTIPIAVGREVLLDSKFRALSIFLKEKNDNARRIKEIDIRINNRVLVTYGS